MIKMVNFILHIYIITTIKNKILVSFFNVKIFSKQIAQQICGTWERKKKKKIEMPQSIPSIYMALWNLGQLQYDSKAEVSEQKGRHSLAT